MKTLIVVEHDNSAMQSSVLHLLAAAEHFVGEIVLLVIGYQCEIVAQQASKLPGVNLVWLVDHPNYVNPLAENISSVVAEIAVTFDVVLAASSTYGKDILPRAAALLDVAQVSDVTQILDLETFVHPIYAGNVMETVRVLDTPKILLIRATAFDAVSTSDNICEIQKISPTIHTAKTCFVSHILPENSRPELTTAKIIVAGGRGLQDAEKYQLVIELADALGAAVGASRAAVDAGFVPNDCQVGQTGKVVSPQLYIAVGISGAVQHIAGMSNSKIIVAINKDKDAPIFHIADYGLVGDLFELVPQLIKCINRSNAHDNRRPERN